MHAHRYSLGAATVAATVGFALLPALPAQAASSVQIVYAYYDSPGKDDGTNASINGEWIKIKNKGTNGRSLKGWTLRDGQNHVYTFGSFTLKAGASVKVRTGKGSNTSINRYWGRRAYVWGNIKDKATLRNAAGTTIDTCSWDSAKVDYRTC